MIRASLRIAVVAALIGMGWAAGRAQTSVPDFEVVVNAPSGETTIECVRGCKLSWVQRGLNPVRTGLPSRNQVDPRAQAAVGDCQSIAPPRAGCARDT